MPRVLTKQEDMAKGLNRSTTTETRQPMDMEWEFTEDAAFMALADAFKESGQVAAMEFLASGEGAFHFQDLAQTAAGEGVDLAESGAMEEFQQQVIDALEMFCRD